MFSSVPTRPSSRSEWSLRLAINVNPSIESQTMSIEIQIQGLNKRQAALADMIWECGTKRQVDAFIAGLPTVQLQDEAKTIVDLMILATIEQCYDGLGSMDEAKQVLRKYNTK